MKASRKDIEFYREMMLREHDEKIALQQEVNSLKEQIRLSDESHKNEITALRGAIETLRMTIEDLTRTNQNQMQQIANLLASDMYLTFEKGPRYNN
jgi:septal ring factor EnvC (AmiA/AmiB activator)